MEEYLLDNGRLTIIDDALDLHYSEPFAPTLLPAEPLFGQALPTGEIIHMILFSDGSQELAVESAGLWNGEYLLKDSDGHIKQRSYYRNGNLHGPSRFYHEALLAESWFIDGKQNGKCLWFYLSGAPYSIQYYRNGKLHGRQLFYYPDGTEKTSMNYLEGKISGDTYLYHPNAALKRHLSF